LRSELPFFASGEIVGDYRPLLKYWEILKRNNCLSEDAFLTNEDFKFLQEIIKEIPALNVESLINMVKPRFLSRLKCEYASEAFREVYGIDIEAGEACSKLASIMAGWLIEAGSNTGILSIRYGWREGRKIDVNAGKANVNT